MPVSSAAPTKPDPPPVPVEQELLQVEPSYTEELTWGQDGESYALSSSSGVWLYRVATRAHTAVLPADHVASVSGGGFVGLSEPGRIPTIWNEEGGVVASLSVGAQVEERERSLLVNRSGVLALLLDPGTSTFTTWDLVERQAVATFPIESGGRWYLSESGRFLIDAQEMGFVIQTRTGAKIDLRRQLGSWGSFIAPLRGKEGFLISKQGGYFEVSLEPPHTRRIDVPKTSDDRIRLLGNDALLGSVDAGLGLYNRATRRMTAILRDEVDEDMVSDDGKYFVSRGGREYRVRASRDGKLAAKSVGVKPLGFRPRSSELALESPEGLMLLDVSSQQRQAIAPSARLLHLGAAAIDEPRQLCAVELEGEELAIVSLRTGTLLHSLGDVESFRWLDDGLAPWVIARSARLAVTNWNAQYKCSLALWEVTGALKQKQSEVACDGRPAWQFSPESGFLMRSSAMTPNIPQSAGQFGIERPGWVLEKRTFDALDREGDWLSVRVNRRPAVPPARGPDPPPSDHPPYAQQLLRLPDGGAIRLDGEAHFTWYDARGVTHDLYCAALEEPTRTGEGDVGSTLFPEYYGDVRFNQKDQLLFSHRGHPALADFRSGSCREFPTALADEFPHPRREVAQLARDGAWLATLSPRGLLIVHDLEHATQRQLQLSRAYASQGLAAGANDRVVVVSGDREVYFVHTRSFRWLRLRLLSVGSQLLPLYDSSDGRFDGSEDALQTVRLRVTRAGEPPKSFDLSEYETHFGVARRDADLVQAFFAEARR